MTVGVVGNNLLNEDIRNSVSYTKDEVLMPGIGVRAFANLKFYCDYVAVGMSVAMPPTFADARFGVRAQVRCATLLRYFALLQSGRTAPETPSEAPSTSSTTSKRL